MNRFRLFNVRATIAPNVDLRRTLVGCQWVSALFLLAMGVIHLYLVLQGADGLLGVLFVLNAAGGVALALAVLVTKRTLLLLACILGLSLMTGTWLALVLALTVGFFGIREQLGGEMVMLTLLVESVGVIVLVATTVIAGWMRQLSKPKMNDVSSACGSVPD